MIKKYFLIILCMMAMPVLSTDYTAGDSGIIGGNRVRLRSGPGTGNRVVAIVQAGDIVKILARSKKRDRLNKKYIHGYHWVKVASVQKKQGWVYGRYCYLLNKKMFYVSENVKSRIEKKAYRLGDVFYFSIGTEQAYPPADSEGLTGSEIHGLPFFLKKGSSRAMPLWLPVQNMKKFIFREERDKNTWFRLKNNEGVFEKIAAVSVITFNGKKSLKIDVKYNSQESAGAYRIICLREKNRLVIKKFLITSGPGW